MGYAAKLLLAGQQAAAFVTKIHRVPWQVRHDVYVKRHRGPDAYLVEWIMTSLRSITEAEKSIAAGERKIAAQKRLIETLERDGLLAQMGAAQEILRSLEDAQERLLAVHARLIAERNR